MNKKFSWSTHGRLLAIILAFAGCFIGLAFVYNGTPYKEVRWDTKFLYQRILDAHSDSTVKAPPDSAIVRMKPRLMDSMITMSDTGFYNAYWRNKVMLATDRLRSDISSIGRLNARDSVIWLQVRDQALTSVAFLHPLKPEFRRADAPEFFARYPSFGVWALLIVIQLTVYFFLFPYALFLLFTIPRDPQGTLWEKPNIIQRMVYLFAIVVVLVLFYVFALYKSAVAKPDFAMPNLDTVLAFTNITGYLTIAVLLAAALSVIPDMQNLKNATPADQQTGVTALEKKVNWIFSITALLLCFGIVSTGALYNGMNSLPFVKQLNRDLGFSIFSADAPYLYGCLHSCILLVFFIPIRARIAAMKLQTARITAAGGEPNTPGAAALSVQDIPPATIKSLLGQLLIGGAPFLVGLLQAFLDYIFK